MLHKYNFELFFVLLRKDKPFPCSFHIFTMHIRCNWICTATYKSFLAYIWYIYRSGGVTCLLLAKQKRNKDFQTLHEQVKVWLIWILISLLLWLLAWYIRNFYGRVALIINYLNSPARVNKLERAHILMPKKTIVCK